MQQIPALMRALHDRGFSTEYSVTGRLRIEHTERDVPFWLTVNNDGRDRFYELRGQEPGVITTVDLPVETDLLLDQLLSFISPEPPDPSYLMLDGPTQRWVAELSARVLVEVTDGEVTKVTILPNHDIAHYEGDDVRDTVNIVWES